MQVDIFSFNPSYSTSLKEILRKTVNIKNYTQKFFKLI